MIDQILFWVLLLVVAQAAQASEAALKASSKSSGPDRGSKASSCQTEN